MKRTLVILCVLFVSCGLDRWQNPTGDTGVATSESESVVEAEQTSSEQSGSSASSTVSTQSTEQAEATTMGTYPQTGTASASNGETGEAEATESFDWARVLITEVVTDPQQDYSESEEGNGIPFDATPGTGTVGTSDEYVEIFNGTADVLDISQWSLSMIDGTDETQLLGDTELDVFFSLDGSAQSFGAGEFAVIGNPAGSLNNTITVDLINELNEVVDEVVIDDANAEGLDDEAFTRLPDGTWALGMATPGTFE